LRLAFVSPLPPLPTGIADYAADVLELLGDRHDVELFHAQEEVDASRLPVGAPLLPASELVARHRERPYDLAVYQMGNGRAHDFVYEWMSRVPGLLVLHDLVLHHSRAARFLDSEEVRAWRSDPSSASARDLARPALGAWRDELEYSYPGRGDRLFAVHLGTVGDLLPYAYPLFRIPVEASRAVAVHNAFMAAAVRAELPGKMVAEVPQPARQEPVPKERVRALRARLGFREDEVVVGSFGLVTPEKRTESLARAIARAAARDPRLRLLLVGPVPDSARLQAILARAGLAGRAVVTGRVPLEELAAHVEVADVVVHLRYPTARETSAALLRVLAQGRRPSSPTSSTRPTCPQRPCGEWTWRTRPAARRGRS
jgi:glycosyltransferase involved in cell wall biosynthesis